MPSKPHSKHHSALQMSKTDPSSQIPHPIDPRIIKCEPADPSENSQTAATPPPDVSLCTGQPEMPHHDNEQRSVIKNEPMPTIQRPEGAQPSPPATSDDREPMEEESAAATDPPSRQTMFGNDFESLLIRIKHLEEGLEVEKMKRKNQDRERHKLRRLENSLQKLLDDDENTRKEPPSLTHPNHSHEMHVTPTLHDSNIHRDATRMNRRSDLRRYKTEPSNDTKRRLPSHLIPRSAKAAERLEDLIHKAKGERFPPISMPAFMIANRISGTNKRTDCLCCAGRHSMLSCPQVPLASQRRRLWRARGACLECRGFHPEKSCGGSSICQRPKCHQLGRHAEEFCDAHPFNVRKLREMGPSSSH